MSDDGGNQFSGLFIVWIEMRRIDALKGRNAIAQGIALGTNGGNETVALNGRDTILEILHGTIVV